MTNAGDENAYANCRPYLTAGTLWKCDRFKNPDCRYALNFGDVFYCINKSLQSQLMSQSIAS